MFFKDSEFDNRDMMNPKTIDALERFRLNLGVPITLTADYATEGHSPNSWHYRGMAVDGMTNAPLWMFIKLAMIEFTGIGLYLRGDKIMFFHLDTRDDGTHQMWVNVNGKYIYKIGG